MGIKESIRKAFKNRLNEANKWDANSQPNLYDLDKFLRKSGYSLRSADYLKGYKFPELFIESSEPEYLHPEILHDLVENAFEVVVENKGILGASDLEEVIKGYENALGVINYLNSLDLTELEVEDEEEEYEEE